MATQSGLGAALKKLRDRKTWSIRDVGKLADIDHAYIHRLETGEKSSPSAELIQKLLRVLKADERESTMVKWLVDHSDSDPGLVEYFLDTPDVQIDEFTMAASTYFRGTGRPDPATLIARARRWIQAAAEE